MKKAHSKMQFQISASAFVLASVLFVHAQPTLAAEGLEPRTGAAVTVTKVAKSCFADTIAVTGVLVPKDEVFVRPDREGLQISQVLVQEGDRVAAGQALVRLVQPDAPAGTAATVLSAPVAGTVRRIAATVGTMASGRAEPLVQIIAQGEIELQADAAPKQLFKLVPGQQAKVTVVGVGEIAGRVRLGAAMIDPMSQLAQIRIAVADSQKLHVGTFGRAVITVGQSCGVAVPMSAVLYGRDGAIVQAVRDNRVETRNVTVGLFSDSDAEIREGIVEGDVVVMRAGAFLREGDRVRPVFVALPAPSR
jgi:HlyD family secretion protein